MAELPRSQLPPDPGYWEELARRIRQDAADPLARYAAAQDDWYGVLARRAPWMVGASAAAMVIVWLVLPMPDSSVSIAWRWMERSLVPNEVAGAMIGGPTPPSVDALMVQFPQTADEGRH